MTLIDVSVPLYGNLPTCPGSVPLSFEPTKVDAPRHFFENAVFTEATLETLLGRTRVIEVTSRRGIGPDDLCCHPLRIAGADAQRRAAHRQT